MVSQVEFAAVASVEIERRDGDGKGQYDLG